MLTGQSRLVRITRLEHSPVAAANITKRAVDAANAKQIDSYLWDKIFRASASRSRRRAVKFTSCNIV